MKAPYFLIQLIFILISGIVSCGPDGSSSESDSTSSGKIAVEILNYDNTIQKIQDLDYVRASSSLRMFVIGSDEIMKGEVLANSQCKTNFDTGISEKEVLLNNVFSLELKDILPSEVFKPTETQDRIVECNFEIRANPMDKKTAVIKLFDVQVKDTNQFYNIEPEFLANSKDAIFHREFLSSLTMKSPEEKVSVETLCSSEIAHQFYDKQSIPVISLFPKRLFQIENLENCRLLIRSAKSKKVWLTKSFFVQNETSQLKLTKEQSFKGTEHILYGEKPILKYTISNAGDSKAYFKLVIPNTSLNIRSIYKGYNDSKYWNTIPFRAPIRWKTSTLEAVVKSQNPNKEIYVLRPGHSAEVALYLTKDVRCTRGGNDSVQGKFCHSVRPHYGQIYDFTNLPYILESLFNDHSLNKWRRTNFWIDGTQKKGGTISYWSPNTRVVKQCGKVKKIKRTRPNPIVNPQIEYFKSHQCK